VLYRLLGTRCNTFSWSWQESGEASDGYEEVPHGGPSAARSALRNAPPRHPPPLNAPLPPRPNPKRVTAVTSRGRPLLASDARSRQQEQERLKEEAEKEELVSAVKELTRHTSFQVCSCSVVT
jgi:hypothetical protein